MAEIEAQAAGIHQTALLLDVIAQHLAQGRMEQMRRRVVQRRGLAYTGIHLGTHRRANREIALEHHAVVQVMISAFSGVAYLEAQTLSRQIAGVPHLSAGFTVKGGAVQHHYTLLSLGEALDTLSRFQQRCDGTLTGSALVAGELGVSRKLQHGVVIDAEGARLLGALALRRHGGLVARHVQRQPALPSDIVGEVHREAVGIVQAEHQFAGYHAAVEIGQRLIQNGHPVVQRAGELLLFV